MTIAVYAFLFLWLAGLIALNLRESFDLDKIRRNR